jgi:hypothetical protein
MISSSPTLISGVGATPFNIILSKALSCKEGVLDWPRAAENQHKPTITNIPV